MADLAVVGDSEFVMGFELIGIKKIFEGETPAELKNSFSRALSDRTTGIIVTNDKALGKLDLNFRRNVENSISPVTVVLSTSMAAQQNLRDMIKKAIGIDLMNR
ncbi:TPA: V-type ATP synthase subunit F [Candidatus Woesearchaeota archaeon]|nr:V-type ATP synthase subunit F [archaeon GW2011_AR15]MBS3104473.1 V-type ATP synthase subunit F [Candidatus Woesearchaeota archaeon]HIH41213.1 V-type ATP synthase subunit F [Candidatus Woesearchaeota archaeon]